jgi:hypothetical protein
MIVTTRSPLLPRRDGRIIRTIFRKTEAEYFKLEGWTNAEFIRICENDLPDGLINIAPRQRVRFIMLNYRWRADASAFQPKGQNANCQLI